MAMMTHNPLLNNAAIHDQWDDFTPEEIDWIDGRVNRLIHALTAKYGLSRDEAARQVDDFLSRQQAPD